MSRSLDGIVESLSDERLADLRAFLLVLVVVVVVVVVWSVFAESLARSSDLVFTSPPALRSLFVDEPDEPRLPEPDDGLRSMSVADEPEPVEPEPVVPEPVVPIEPALPLPVVPSEPDPDLSLPVVPIAPAPLVLSVPMPVDPVPLVPLTPVALSLVFPPAFVLPLVELPAVSLALPVLLGAAVEPAPVDCASAVAGSTNGRANSDALINCPNLRFINTSCRS